MQKRERSQWNGRGQLRSPYRYGKTRHVGEKRVEGVEGRLGEGKRIR